MSPTHLLGITWTELAARLVAGDALDCWARREPALRGLAGADHVAAIAHGGLDSDRTDALIGALVRLGAVDGGNEQDAALLVAHLLANGARKIALQLADLSADIDVVVAGALWIQIRTFAWRQRHRAYAKSLLLDTRHAVLAELRPYRSRAGIDMVIAADPTPSGLLTGFGRATHDPLWAARADGLGSRLPGAPGDVEGQDAGTELAELLSWATRRGVISHSDAQLLTELTATAHLVDVTARRGRNVAAEISRVATRHGVHERTVRRRRDRAMAALQSARADYLADVS